MNQQSLAGDWELVSAGETHRCTMALPGDGISALHAAGLIPAPYWGRNEYDLRWISETDWIARRTFELDDNDVELVLSEVDTVADIKINDTMVASFENAFRTYRIPLSDAAKPGTNRIEITFRSPVKAGQAKYESHPFEIPWSENCPIPYGNFIRKPACDFGWDWNIALAPFGIYGAMRLEPSSQPRIDSVLVTQAHADGQVVLNVSVKTANISDNLTLQFDGHSVELPVSHDRATGELSVSNPKLWWPSGHGEQPLYDLTVSCGEIRHKQRIGLRDIELVSQKDDAGRGFGFRVNGRNIFCKGANWILADALPGRITVQKTRDLLQSAKDANMNMIRVWGGGRYEFEDFYECCDELGLLVWQDFMFACNLYPSDPDFLNQVKAEIHDNVPRIQSHACLALWCGDNELIGALDWYDCSRKDRDRYLVNYDRLNRTIEDTLRDICPAANWWPSSPSPGLMSFGDAWHNDGSGDMHFWSVWHEGRDFDHYRDVSPRFCSEFGFQCYPSMNTIRTFAAPGDQNIAAPVFESHQKNAGGNARIAETMFRYFRWPEGFEDFVYLSQVQQALAIKTAVTDWRAKVPHCMGTLFWQLNDTWPVCSWASLDYGGDWRLLHHAAQGFYSDVIVTAVPDAEAISVVAVSDRIEQTNLSVTIAAVNLSGERRPLQSLTQKIQSSAKVIGHVNFASLADDELLLLEWTSDSDSGREIFAPKPYKSYELLTAGLSFSSQKDEGSYKLKLKSNGLSLFTAMEADCHGRFSGNLFDMTKGETITLSFTPSDPDDTPIFKVRDLHSATFR